MDGDILRNILDQVPSVNAGVGIDSPFHRLLDDLHDYCLRKNPKVRFSEVMLGVCSVWMKTPLHLHLDGVSNDDVDDSNISSL